MNICLIPARSGSKRIKNKNIKMFHGKPIIAYAINNAKKSKLFDKIIVSTDSSKIAKLSKKYGAEIPFLRPKKLSNDKAVDKSVLAHFLKNFTIKPKFLCYLYPTTPLLKTKTLVNCYKELKKKNYYQIFTISRYYPNFQKSFEKKKNNELKIYNHKSKKVLPIKFFDAGQCYWYNFSKKKIIKKSLGYEVSKSESIDINTLKDLKLAKKIYAYKIKN